MNYAKEYYAVPADIGRRVMVNGRPGIIAKDRGHYIGVNFDDDRPGVVCNCHPAWQVEYGEIGKIRKMTRSQKRYQDFIDADFGISFAEYLGIDSKFTKKAPPEWREKWR